MSIDLHAHTRASDGSFEPRELIQHAKNLGLSAVGVTDHDTFGGWDEALQWGEKIGVEVVPGIELSVSDEHGKFHLLGYFVERESNLGHRLERIQKSRANRNLVILDNLAALQMPVEWARVEAIAGEGAQIGRPHIARAMMELGYVSSVKEAFDVWLGDGKPAHSGKSGFSPREAVELIHDAGGIAIWAHPLRSPSERSFAATFEDVEAQILLWKSWNLDGIETFYGDYTPEEAAWSAQMARKYDLLPSGGSDFHGLTKPDVVLGKVNGGASVPDSVLADLKSHLLKPK